MKNYELRTGDYIYTKEDIEDYLGKITDIQANELVNPCNKFKIYPRICAWYKDIDDFYTDWIYDNNICSDEEDADHRYESGCKNGEFKMFKDGSIVRLSL